MKKSIIITIIVLILLGVGTFIAVKKLRPSGKYVRTGKVKRRDIVSKVTAFGRVQPTEEVKISAKVSGEIIKMYVEEGDTVKRGDSLLKVNPEQYSAQKEQMEANLNAARARVAEAKANFEQTKAEYERVKTMYNKGMTSEEAFRKAKTQYEVAKAQLNSAYEGVKQAKGRLREARESLEETVILSPQEGVVIGIYSREGEYVVQGRVGTQGSVILKVAQLNKMEAKVDVDETDIPEIDEGQETILEFDAFPDTTVKGAVIKISNEANIQNQGSQSEIATFPVRIAILEDLKGLKPGMSVKAEIITDRAENSLAVPIQSVVEKTPKALNLEKTPSSRDGKTKKGGKEKGDKEPSKAKASFHEKAKVVFEVKDQKAMAVPVKTGIMDERYIQIQSGLQEGDKIVIGSYKTLRSLEDEDPVSVAPKRKGKYGRD